MTLALKKITYLSRMDKVLSTSTHLRSLSFLEVNQNWKVHAGKEIPVHKGFICPPICPAYHNILPTVDKPRTASIYFFQLKGGAVKRKAQAGRLYREKGGK